MPVVAEVEMRRRRSRGRREPVERHGDVAEAAGERHRRGGAWGQRRRRALVALGEEAEGVDLADEVGHACPAAEAEADHQHPRHHERVDHVRARPTPHQPRRRLHRVLQRATTGQIKTSLSIQSFFSSEELVIQSMPTNSNIVKSIENYCVHHCLYHLHGAQCYKPTNLNSTCSMFPCSFFLSRVQMHAALFGRICFGGRLNFCGSRRLDAVRYK